MDERNFSALRSFKVNRDEDNPWGTSLCFFNASSKVLNSIIYRIGAKVSILTIGHSFSAFIIVGSTKKPFLSSTLDPNKIFPPHFLISSIAF